jgi:hypothetical protein
MLIFEKVAIANGREWGQYNPGRGCGRRRDIYSTTEDGSSDAAKKYVVLHSILLPEMKQASETFED